MFTDLSAFSLIKVIRKSSHQHKFRDNYDIMLFFELFHSVVDSFEERLTRVDGYSIVIFVVFNKADLSVIAGEKVFVNRNIVNN